MISGLLHPSPAPRVDVRLVALAYASLITCAAILPRASAAALAIVGCMAVVANGLHRVTWPDRLSYDAWTLSLITFAGLAALSSFWSHDPAKSFGKAALLLLMLISANAAVVAIRRDALDVLRWALFGVLVAVIAAALLTVFETLTAQALTRKAFSMFPSLQAGYERHVKWLDGSVSWISPTNINRRTAFVTLLLWPAAAAAAIVFRGRLRIGLLAGFATAALLLLWRTQHQSSQVALIAGTMAFLMYMTVPRAAGFVLSAAWSAAVLLIVPLSLLAYKAEFYKVPWLFQSAHHRVVIWGYTAEQISLRPILGVGADATAGLDSEREMAEVVMSTDHLYARRTARHAHNVYLQTWYELGAVGAIALLVMGLTAIRAIRFASAAVQPWAAGLFAASAAMIAFSYSFWQVWFQAAFGLAVVALTLVDTLSLNGESGSPPDFRRM